MRILITVGLLLCVCTPSALGHAASDFSLRVRLTTGERSKDSSSQTTTLTIAPDTDTIVWSRTFTGRRRTARPPNKEFKLSPADRATLVKLISASELLVTNSIELPRDPDSYTYFSISVDLTMDGKKGALTISGPRTAVKVKEEKSYQDALALVKEIYRIINTEDKTVRFDELVVK